MRKAILLCIFAVMMLPFGSWLQDVSADRTVRLQATINPGSLITDIRDQAGNSIPQPQVSLGEVANSIDCQFGPTALRAELGSEARRIYVDNPKAAFDGWTLTLASAAGPDAKWAGREGHELDFNDAAAQGCSDGDNDGVAGLLIIDPSQAEVRSDCLECSANEVFVVGEAQQSFGNLPSITLLRATESADHVGSWYMTGVDIRQSIPPGQDGDTYEFDLVLTATST